MKVLRERLWWRHSVGWRKVTNLFGDTFLELPDLHWAIQPPVTKPFPSIFFFLPICLSLWQMWHILCLIQQELVVSHSPPPPPSRLSASVELGACTSIYLFPSWKAHHSICFYNLGNFLFVCKFVIISHKAPCYGLVNILISSLWKHHSICQLDTFIPKCHSGGESWSCKDWQQWSPAATSTIMGLIGIKSTWAEKWASTLLASEDKVLKNRI